MVQSGRIFHLPLAAKIQTFRDLDKPVKEPVEASVVEATDPRLVYVRPFFLGL